MTSSTVMPLLLGGDARLLRRSAFLLARAASSTAEQRAAPLDAAVRVGFEGAAARPPGGCGSRRRAPARARGQHAGLRRAAREPGLQRDALGELANIICGNVLPLLAGAEDLFRLSAPAGRPPRPRAPAGRMSAQAELGLEDGPRAAVRSEIDAVGERPARVRV